MAKPTANPNRLSPPDSRARTAHAPQHRLSAPPQPTFTTPQPGKTRPRRLGRLILTALLATTALLLTAAPALAAEPPSGLSGSLRITEFPPGATTVTSALQVTVNPNGSNTTVELQYVDAAGYEPAAADPYAAGGSVSTEITTELSQATTASLIVHLATGALYHYRLLATNAAGPIATSDATVETYPPTQGPLPDSRAYEQVSPADKNQQAVLGVAENSNMLASPSGSAFAYFSLGSLPVDLGGEFHFTPQLSSFAAARWQTQGPLPAFSHPQTNRLVGYTEDLAGAILVSSVQPPLAPGASGGEALNAYLRDSATGAYSLLAPDVQDPTLGFAFVAASANDSRLLFENEAPLLPEAASGVDNLYLWDATRPEGERLSLAGVATDAECAARSLPAGCAPERGSDAGPNTGEITPPPGGQPYLQQQTLSADGSRAFFTAHPSGRLYERLLDLGETVPVSLGAAEWLSATPDGRYVFYSEAEELYRFDTEAETRQALTSGAEGVLGTLGVSADGSYAYFVAHGVLAANHGANEEQAAQGTDHLSVWHEGAVTFLAALLPDDSHDWILQRSPTVTKQIRTSRVSPDGVALFQSTKRLTGYDNGGAPELYLYRPELPLSSANPLCVSCNPAGAATGGAGLGLGTTTLQGLVGPNLTPHLPRNLSAAGSRVFFETIEPLLPADVNGLSDVYEWEAPGAGSCEESSSAFRSQDGGCLYLISTGTSHEPSYFGDASADGDSAFFFTAQPLVGQDTDLGADVYDARVGGGLAYQNPPAEPECEEAEACKPHPTEPPAESSGATGSFRGPEEGPNHPQPPRCRRGFVRRHGHCVRKRTHRGKHHRRANANQRGAK
jgi:hypothetical protein